MGGKYKVLIVDDEVLIRQGIKHYVNWEKEGFQIVGEAANGQEALEIIKQTKPDIVLTDIVMPIIDGEQLTKIIKKDYPQIQVVILSSFSNFDYVRSTFQNGVSDYILKPTLNGEELLAALTKATKSLPEKKFMKAVSEKRSTIDQLIESSLSGYPFDYDDQLVQTTFPDAHYCLLHIENTQHQNLQMAEEIDNIPYIHPVPVVQKKNTRVLLLHFKPHDFASIRKNVVELAERISEYNWTLGEPFSNLKDVKSQYDDQLTTLVGLRFYLPMQQVLQYDEIPIKTTEEKMFDLNHFIELYKFEQFDLALLYLTDFVTAIINDYQMTEQEFKAFLGNIIFNITVILGNLDYQHQQLDKEKYQYFSQIDEAKTAVEAVQLLNIFLDEVRNVVNRKKTNSHQSNMQKLLNYIDAHYAEPLSLTDIANHFHFNPSYLSTYFSTHYRIGFTEYMNEIRIAKAKELLEKQTTSISSISGMVGYSDHSYFCKVFKKQTGVSPSNFRKRHIK